MPTVRRRDFLLLRSARGTTGAYELSCERLYMHYVDALMDGSAEELFNRLDEQLKGAVELRLVEASWLRHAGLRARLDPVLTAFRARGGIVAERAGGRS